MGRSVAIGTASGSRAPTFWRAELSIAGETGWNREAGRSAAVANVRRAAANRATEIRFLELIAPLRLLGRSLTQAARQVQVVEFVGLFGLRAPADLEDQRGRD